ncbi:hypothetical protein HHUSO_G4336 [Huso huso]|uniref:Integrase zinc-binding domain-containing protein n=1 Tax=Huso huso TaxID=61971 RepID=A0ABR1A4S7_HUSHU
MERKKESAAAVKVLRYWDAKQWWEEYHDRACHQGQEKTLSILKNTFYRPGMDKDSSLWLMICSRCLLRKGKPDGYYRILPEDPQTQVDPAPIEEPRRSQRENFGRPPARWLTRSGAVAKGQH